MYAFHYGAILILSDPGFGGSAASLLYSPPRLLSMQPNSLLNDECTYACKIYIYSSKIYKYSKQLLIFLPIKMPLGVFRIDALTAAILIK